MSKEKQHLQRTMTARHIMMMALGGAIGAGLFKGSSAAIDKAGPAVIIAYLIGGIILMFVMQGMAELAVQNKNTQSFNDLIRPSLGNGAAYFFDWIYWKVQVLNIAAESITAAIFIQYWFPEASVWIIALTLSIVVTLINLISVKVFAETEYWLALTKITIIVVFIVAGLLLLFVSFGQHHAIGLSNLHEHGGFFPNGFSGLMSAMLIVIYSYGGAEVIGMTLAETKNPETVVPKAVRSTLLRIISFYILPFFIICSLIPWYKVNNVVESPFVTVFRMIGIPYAGDIVNFIIILAIISSMNSGIYASSRVLYTQAINNQLPALFKKLTKRNIPVFSIIVCAATLYLGVCISIFAGSKTFGYLVESLSYSILIIWIMIAVSHLRSRFKPINKATYYVRWFPFSSVVAVVSLAVIGIGVILNTKFIITLITFIIYVFITMTYVIKKRKRS